MSVFWQKKGCLLSGKNQRFIKIRVLFWPEISALGVFFNFDNERMHPPKYPSDPPGIMVGLSGQFSFMQTEKWPPRVSYHTT